MPATWYEGRVIRIEDLSPNTKSFLIEVPDLEQFEFRAGQFITLDLPIHEKRLQRWRSYSIASAPDGTNTFELCIVRLEGGLATRYLFEEVREGTILRFKGPGGVFVLPETIDQDLVLICTGTGVAPFRSMLFDLLLKGKPHRNLHLIFGTRYQEGILYKEAFLEYREKVPEFRYSVALSRETDLEAREFPFEIRQGYVHPFYLEQYKERRSDVLFLLCGWSDMVDEATAYLTGTLGYPPGQVIAELYG